MFKIDRKPGDRWNIRGPVEYVPPVEVEVVMKRQAIPLDENEGIYVRDIKTGKVRHYYKNTLMQCIWPFSSCMALIGGLRLPISRGYFKRNFFDHDCQNCSEKFNFSRKFYFIYNGRYFWDRQMPSKISSSFERSAFKLSTSDCSFKYLGLLIPYSVVTTQQAHDARSTLMTSHRR